MDKYILATRFDLGFLNIWGRLRKVDLQLVSDDEAPLGIVIRKGMYELGTTPVKLFIIKVSEEGYNKMKPFIRDL